MKFEGDTIHREDEGLAKANQPPELQNSLPVLTLGILLLASHTQLNLSAVREPKTTGGQKLGTARL